MLAAASRTRAVGAQRTAANADARFRAHRVAMVDRQIAGEGIKDSATLRAMRAMPRHEFVPVNLRDEAYENHPLPIGLGQTISQPYIVGFMTEIVRPKHGRPQTTVRDRLQPPD